MNIMSGTIHKDPILEDIIDFCALRQMSWTQFGLLAVNDPALVITLQRGREVRRKTRDRITTFMSEFPDGGSHADR